MPGRLLSPAARLSGASLLRMQADERLVALARGGHEAACTAIVHRYRAPLERYCARILGPARAEDAVQHTFASAFADLRSDDDNRALELRPWLYRIAHHAALRQLRASVATSDPALEPRALERTEELAEMRDHLRRTLAAIDALPERERDAIVLHAFAGRSHVQVADALGLTPGAARQTLYRARATLRAAVTAITPYPVLLRLAFEGAATSMRVAVVKVAGGAGVAALATGAVVGAGGPAAERDRRPAGSSVPAPGLTRSVAGAAAPLGAVAPPGRTVVVRANGAGDRPARRSPPRVTPPRPGTPAPASAPPPLPPGVAQEPRGPEATPAPDQTDGDGRRRRPDGRPEPERRRPAASADPPVERTPAVTAEPERGDPAPPTTTGEGDRPRQDPIQTPEPVPTDGARRGDARGG